MGSYAGRLRCFKVALLIADHEASIDIHRMPLQQRSNHPRLRLTTVAEDTVALNQAVGMVGTKFERVNMGTNSSKLTRHPFVQIANMPFLIKPPRDSGLVRHDKRKITGVIDCLYRLLGSFHPPDLVRIKSIAIVLVEDAIAIKKYCRTHQAHQPALEGTPIFRRSRLLLLTVRNDQNTRTPFDSTNPMRRHDSGEL
ncbi:hypothetical protein A5906_15080 [Bradyrhizobium sacchari]|uniref:Uncharacterized protein n=1 Tax=Bradyrhizobium sacchari TaxID=1399419 RepID=A0A560JVU9_9BRAD|nr:hypothetical protein A5906_15080 [Bradyrhizobium sacchari]TWB59200.1 hypothetical protein FBZ94_105476 [Bradyrhizobium sacchari]TWB72440.1 hypothetical protein FBZ95_106155 [Bradyrhizobium sacchari]